MKNKILVFFAFLFFAVLVSGCSEKKTEIYFNNQQQEKAGESVEDSLKSSSEEITENIGAVNEKSIQNLLSKNSNFYCTWKIEKAEVNEDAEVDNEDEEATGGIEENEIFVQGNNFLKKTKIQENSRTTEVNVLGLENQVYSWNSLIAQGTKMSLEDAQNNEIIDLNISFDWICEEANISAEIFEIPTEIEFIEMAF